MTNTYLIISSLIFAVVGVVHVLRLAMGWPVMLGTLSVPLWPSFIVILVCAIVALWGLSLLQGPSDHRR